MKYKLIKLKKENDLNRLLKKQKREKQEISILFISNWDKYSAQLVKEIEKKYNDLDEGKPLYIVDNYHMPHSFVIFKSFMLPQLVNLGKNRVYVQEYLPEIYRIFDLE